MTQAYIMGNVYFGKNPFVERYCYLGISPTKLEKPLEFGDNCIIRAGSYIYEGSFIGDSFQTGNKVNIREYCTIGNNVSIGTHSIIEHHVLIEDNVRIHSNVFIPEYTVLKKGCWIAPNVVFTNAKYPNQSDTKDKLEGVLVGENAIIGANATILPGILIGKNAFIGAGATITKNVEEGETVIGIDERLPKKKYCNCHNIGGTHSIRCEYEQEMRK